MREQPIGIFDSGIGGTSIWREVHELLPCENTLYLADSKNAPYGEKGKEKILELSIKNTEFLLDQGCKLIVVACNTATTNAIDYLRANYNVPFVGIEPAIKPAALSTKTRSVGILATKGTLSSELFNKTSAKFASDIKVIEQIGEGLVPLIETGDLDSPELNHLLSSYLRPMIEHDIDYLVLGCSHYPYLIPLIKKILPGDVTIIDSGQAVARQTRALLENHRLLNNNKTPGKCKFYSNGDFKILDMITGGKYQVEYLDF